MHRHYGEFWEAPDASIFLIYALLDPRDGRVRYVGKTNNMVSRYRTHTQSHGQSKNDPYSEPGKKRSWFEELKSLGLKPEVRILETVIGKEQWLDREKHWIAHFASPELMNGRRPRGKARETRPIAANLTGSRP